jgi:hypothetical protein
MVHASPSTDGHEMWIDTCRSYRYDPIGACLQAKPMTTKHMIAIETSWGGNDSLTPHQKPTRHARLRTTILSTCCGRASNELSVLIQ